MHAPLVALLGVLLLSSPVARAEDLRPAVVTAPIEIEEVVQSETFVGRVEAIEQVDLRARVQGFLEAVAFRDGDDVAAGDLLYEIERARYEADLAAAEARVARARAEVVAARLALDRLETLAARQAVSEAQRDEARARFDGAEAEVRAGEAAVRQAELLLSYTRITAPISGRIGATNVTVGNLVEPGTGPLARIVKLDPIRVRFFVGDVDYVTVQRQLVGEGGAALDGRFRASLQLPDGERYEQEGVIDFFDTTIDATTGTLAVRATFPNPDRLLLPGQFVTVVVEVGEPREVPVVPFAAVQQDREGRFVLVVDDDGIVHQRRVELGTAGRATYEVLDGLEPGEEVIVQGVQRVREGVEVRALRDRRS
ncbi:MAG: efflux RND transporter periplasmic adaptor subunit [Geminicoccaceae bacterium]|nr:MAG: efflux RND transporter periplasmic adaptor subunit [Geminicoccaceae bacterium]